MAQSDRSQFLGVLVEAEKEMAALLAGLAHDVGDLVLRESGPDGKVPLQRLGELQRKAREVVDAAFIGPARQPFDERHQPLAPYARIVANGQGKMIDLALERAARIVEARLPEDLQARLFALQVKRA